MYYSTELDASTPCSHILSGIWTFSLFGQNLYYFLNLSVSHYDILVDGISNDDNDNDSENMFITIDLHLYKIQDARYKYTEKEHQTLFFLW